MGYMRLHTRDLHYVLALEDDTLYPSVQQPLTKVSNSISISLGRLQIVGKHHVRSLRK